MLGPRLPVSPPGSPPPPLYSTDLRLSAAPPPLHSRRLLWRALRPPPAGGPRLGTLLHKWFILWQGLPSLDGPVPLRDADDLPP
eukprot:6803697-Pyramimonas_sp.AAC.1